jgi:hypothetical protein
MQFPLRCTRPSSTHLGAVSDEGPVEDIAMTSRTAGRDMNDANMQAGPRVSVSVGSCPALRVLVACSAASWHNRPAGMLT